MNAIDIQEIMDLTGVDLSGLDSEYCRDTLEGNYNPRPDESIHNPDYVGGTPATH